VNLGVAGANPRDYLDHLRDPGLAYEPDVVLVMVMANDVENRWVQLEFDVQIASQVLANARRAVLAPPPSWTRIPKAVFPALYTLVWKRLHALGADARRTEAGGRRAERTNAAPAPSPPSATAEAVLLKLADCYQRREFIEHFLTTVPPGRLDGLRPVLEGTVPPDADATEPYLRVKALVDPRLLADLVLLPPRYDAAWDDVARQLRRIVALARWERARPVLIFAPAAHQVTAAGRPYLESLGFAWDERTLTDTTFADRLRAFARSENVLFVDLLPVLRQHRDEGLYFPRDGHWTPAGHALAAAEIARALATPDVRAMSSRNRGGRTR
jgi:lysophospholipase L1-like esterase